MQWYLLLKTPKVLKDIKAFKDLEDFTSNDSLRKKAAPYGAAFIEILVWNQLLNENFLSNLALTNDVNACRNLSAVSNA